MRPASVTIPAPRTTPKIPSRGLFDSSAGAADESARTICVGEGCATAIVVAILRLRSVSCANRGDNGKPRTQGSGNARIIEPDLYGDSLHDFREITGGIVRRQQRELRTAGGRDLDHFAVDHPSRVRVDADLRRVADLHIGELRLAIICLYPLDPADE